MLVVKDHVSELLRELKEGLEAIYGPRLRGVYLYGSYARDEADPESDVDVLVVLEDFESYCGEVDRTGQLNADLCLKYSLSATPVFLREREWLHGDAAFLINVRREAIRA